MNSDRRCILSKYKYRSALRLGLACVVVLILVASWILLLRVGSSQRPGSLAIADQAKSQEEDLDGRSGRLLPASEIAVPTIDAVDAPAPDRRTTITFPASTSRADKDGESLTSVSVPRIDSRDGVVWSPVAGLLVLTDVEVVVHEINAEAGVFVTLITDSGESYASKVDVHGVARMRISIKDDVAAIIRLYHPSSDAPLKELDMFCACGRLNSIHVTPEVALHPWTVSVHLRGLDEPKETGITSALLLPLPPSVNWDAAIYFAGVPHRRAGPILEFSGACIPQGGLLCLNLGQDRPWCFVQILPNGHIQMTIPEEGPVRLTTREINSDSTAEVSCELVSGWDVVYQLCVACWGPPGPRRASTSQRIVEEHKQGVSIVLERGEALWTYFPAVWEISMTGRDRSKGHGYSKVVCDVRKFWARE